MNSREIDMQYRYKNLNGNFFESCANCKKLVDLDHRVKIGKTTDTYKMMRDLCIDCAEINCKVYIGAKNLNLRSNLDHLKKDCEKSLSRAEKIKNG